MRPPMERPPTATRLVATPSLSASSDVAVRIVWIHTAGGSGRRFPAACPGNSTRSTTTPTCVTAWSMATSPGWSRPAAAPGVSINPAGPDPVIGPSWFPGPAPSRSAGSYHWDVGQDGDTTLGRPTLLEGERAHESTLVEEVLPSAHQDGVDHEAVLVDQATAAEIVDQLRASVDQQRVVSALQASHGLGHVALDEGCVPLALDQGRRGDVLRQPVHAVSEAGLITHGRPGRLESLVGHTTEEQGIALEEVLVLETLELLVEIGPAPGRFLHDSVQGDVLHCDNLSHDVRPSCHERPFGRSQRTGLVRPSTVTTNAQSTIDTGR